MTDLPRALGFIRTDISGSLLDGHRRGIRNYAAANKLDLVHTLVIPANVRAPIFPLIENAHRRKVDVIIVPTLDHVQAWKRGVTEQWGLRVVAGAQEWARGYRWEPQVPSVGGGRNTLF